MYTAYLINETSRKTLAEQFPPKYERVLGHHITVDFGVPMDTPLPPDAAIMLIAHFDTGDGLEGFVAMVNKTTFRGDGKIFHLTWSLDPSKYKPVDSNKVILQWAGNYPLGEIDDDLLIQVDGLPAILD
jgi:hypothetical protein